MGRRQDRGRGVGDSTPAFGLGQVCCGGPVDACLPAQPPSCSLSLQGERRVAAAARARASPDLRPCLTLVPTKPCDATRPQERGFNKRYRFLELRLGGFPEEDRLCVTVPAAPFLLRCPRSRPPSLSQSDYLETPPAPPAGAPCPSGWAFSSATSLGAPGTAHPESPPEGPWDARAGPDKPGTPGHPETHPSSLPLPLPP